MASYTAHANYVIWFSDLAEYNAAVALAGGIGFGHCPFTAATTFGITWPLVGGGPITGTKGIYYSNPVYNPGSEIYHPGPTGIFYDDTVDYIDVPGQAGNPPQAVGPDLHLVWWGCIIYAGQDVVGTPPVTPIPKRRWIHGWEYTGANYEGDGPRGNAGSREASRSQDGMGWSYRGNNAAETITQFNNQFVPGFSSKTSWERFYIRIHQYGGTKVLIWRCRGSVSAGGAGIKITPAGQIELYDITLAGAETLQATSIGSLSLNQWYLIDVLVKYPVNAADFGQLRVYVNHVLAVQYQDTSGGSLDTVQDHTNTIFGVISGQDTLWCFDVDDWISADVPNNGGIESLDSADWIIGSHCRRVDVDSATFTNYAGVVQQLAQFFGPGNQVNSLVTSSTALATIRSLTDASNNQIYPGLTFGAVAAYIAVCSYSAALVTARLGYKIAGGADVWFSENYETTTARWWGTLYAPAPITVPVEIAPFSILKEKSNDANLNRIYAQSAEVEYIGLWGPEDFVGTPNYSNNVNRHNCRYLNTEWSYGIDVGAPTAPVFSIGGTYVGNGTGQDINLPAPCHFIWIRGLSGINGCPRWFAAGLSGHQGTSDNVVPNYISRIWMDSTGQYKFSVGGSAANINALGVTYQYIAFCDPGNRFNICGAYNWPNTVGSARAIPLWVNNFLPQFGWNTWDNTGTATGSVQPTIKGPGNAGSTGVNFNGAAVNLFGTFALGLFTPEEDSFYATFGQCNYSLWRTTDALGITAVQLFSYTGDGTGVRIIPFPIVTGRWPLFAYVQPHNATGYFRDPSHAGNNSSSVINGANSTTRIVGGAADLIVVGTDLNQVGATYEVFILLGDDGGWNNGDWTIPNGGAEGGYIPEPYNPSGVGIGGLEFNGLVPLLAVKNMSGIYTLVPNKTNDTIYTGFGASTVDVKKPNPMFKTGYIGG